MKNWVLSDPAHCLTLIRVPFTADSSSFALSPSLIRSGTLVFKLFFFFFLNMLRTWQVNEKIEFE